MSETTTETTDVPLGRIAKAKARWAGLGLITKILVIVLVVGICIGGYGGYGMLFGADDEVADTEVTEPMTASVLTAEASDTPAIPTTSVGVPQVGDFGPECYTANKVARLEVPWDAVIVRSGDAWSENNTAAIMAKGVEDGRLMDVRVNGVHRPSHSDANQVYYDNAKKLSGRKVTVYPTDTILKPQKHDQQSASVTMADGTDLAEYLVEHKIAIRTL